MASMAWLSRKHRGPVEKNRLLTCFMIAPEPMIRTFRPKNFHHACPSFCRSNWLTRNQEPEKAHFRHDSQFLKMSRDAEKQNTRLLRSILHENDDPVLTTRQDTSHLSVAFWCSCLALAVISRIGQARGFLMTAEKWHKT